MNEQNKSEKKSIPKLLRKLEKMIDSWEEAKNTDTHIYITQPKKAIWANLMIGIARGVGFVIGASVIGVILITAVGWILTHFVTVPIIGNFIALIVKHVQDYLSK